LSPEIPAIDLPQPEIEGSFLGDGYGHPTDAGRQATEEMKTKEGITLEPCYTAKTFAAVLEHLETQKASGPVLYWHTYNSVDLTGQARAVDLNRLAPEFRKMVS
jgi:hypothetical protein